VNVVEASEPDLSQYDDGNWRHIGEEDRDVGSDDLFVGWNEWVHKVLVVHEKVTLDWENKPIVSCQYRKEQQCDQVVHDVSGFPPFYRKPSQRRRCCDQRGVHVDRSNVHLCVIWNYKNNKCINDCYGDRNNMKVKWLNPSNKQKLKKERKNAVVCLF